MTRPRKPASASAVEGEPLELASAPDTVPEATVAHLAQPAAPEPANTDFPATPPEPPQPSVTPSAAQPERKLASAKPRLKIPPILLEGDQPQPLATGPGEKYALGPAPTAGPRIRQAAHLPEAYGTGRVMLVARDPHWLYAHWDLTPQQQRRHNALSTDRHLVVRVQPGTIAGHASTEVHVHPESRSWFIHVEGADTRYSAELGYYPASGPWVTVASSPPVVTPPDTVSRDRTLRFATIPLEVPLRNPPAPARQFRHAEPPPLREQQERAMEAVFKRYQILQQPPSSLEITELIRGAVAAEVPPAPPVLPTPIGAQIEGISSPPGGEAQLPKGFWLNLNAELVLYGATQPDASVTIGGQPIALRPDGSFSFRFALPDGDYELTVSAMSANGDFRQGHLRFTRRTDHQGEVGTAPQDPSLTPPTAKNP